MPVGRAGKVSTEEICAVHGRYITVTPERALVTCVRWGMVVACNRYNLQPFHFRNSYATAVSLLKPPCGGFRSETATWIQKWFKISVGTVE